MTSILLGKWAAYWNVDVLFSLCLFLSVCWFIVWPLMSCLSHSWLCFVGIIKYSPHALLFYSAELLPLLISISLALFVKHLIFDHSAAHVLFLPRFRFTPSAPLFLHNPGRRWQPLLLARVWFYVLDFDSGLSAAFFGFLNVRLLSFHRLLTAVSPTLMFPDVCTEQIRGQNRGFQELCVFRS